MDCNEVSQHLDEFACGGSMHDEAKQIQTHLAGCRFCSWRLDRIRRVVTIVGWPRELASSLSDAVHETSSVNPILTTELPASGGGGTRMALLLACTCLVSALALHQPHRPNGQRALALPSVAAPVEPSPQEPPQPPSPDPASPAPNFPLPSASPAPAPVQLAGTALVKPAVPSPAPSVSRTIPAAKAAPVPAEHDRIAAVLGSQTWLLEGDAARESSRRMLATTEMDALAPDAATFLKNLDGALQKTGRLHIQQVLLGPLAVEIHIGGEFPAELLPAELRDLRAAVYKLGARKSPMADVDPAKLAGRRLMRLRIGLLSKVRTPE